jgi:hypothetical protein
MIRIFTVLTYGSLKMSAVDQIMLLAGCSKEAAEDAFERHGDVVLALDELLETPVCKGTRYIPPPPKIDRMMTPEQEALCKKGRETMDKLNAEQTTAYRLANQQVAKDVGSTVPSSAPQRALPSSVPDSGS